MNRLLCSLLLLLLISCQNQPERPNILWLTIEESARAFELVENKPASAMSAGKKEWVRLKEETEGKWKGYDL